ncbi:MAG: serine/threonine-protein kinase [Candidatus Levyibacteriota bacterium]
MSEILNGAYVDMNLPPIGLHAGSVLRRGYYVGNIHLESVVGDSGGSAIVYRGYDRSMRRREPRALKVARTTDPEQLATEIEMHVAVSGKSENILLLLDHGVGRLPNGTDRQFMHLEYAPDGSVADQLSRQGGLPAEQAIRYAEQTASGLHVVHQEGMVHGDVKPANALRNEAVIKLADFGTARRTRTSDVISGSPLYMAPEQANQRALIDPRTDVRGLAVMTFEMLQGFPLFDRSTSAKQQLELLVDDREYDSFVRETVHKLGEIGYGAFETPIRQAVSRNMDDRPADPRAFAADLRNRLRDINDDVKDHPTTVFVSTKNVSQPELVATRA